MQLVQQTRRSYSAIFIVALCLAGSVSSAWAQADVEIPFVSDPGPTIDGNVDDLWSLCTPQSLTHVLEGSSPTSPADCSVQWQGLCSPQALYVLVDVQDESLIQDSSSGWDDDRVEVFIDGDNSKDSTTNATAANDFQYNFRWNRGVVETPVEYYAGKVTGVQYAVVTTPAGYRMEIKLPWSTLTGKPAQVGQLIGIDVLIDDDDDGGSRDTQMSWYTTTTPPHDPRKWGTAVFVTARTAIASNPEPPHQATDVSPDVVLGWTPGLSAASHDVYFGASFEDVNNASRTAPGNVPRSQGQEPNSFDPGHLELGQTYYWRIDEVNAPPSGTISKGMVWSFTVEPKSLPIAGSHITATASSSGTAAVGPDRTIDGSGLNADDQHSTVPTDMWLSAGTGPTPVWIQYAFDKPYILDKLLVWNSNQSLEAIFGFGCKDVTVEYSMDGVAWATLGDFQFAQASGSPTYTANTTVPFGDVVAQQVKLTIHSNYNGSLPQKGLSEVRFYAIPVAARLPSPADGAVNVAPQTTLSWRAGRLASSHEVYLSTDSNAVADGTAPMVAVSQPRYDASLNLATTYYWEVIEVNAAATPAAWDGPVWNLSTAPYLVVDDFESYTNDSPNRVFQTWLDGMGYTEPAPGKPGNGTGSVLGNDPQVGNIMEMAVVHGGSQSAPVFYDNATAAATSEITRTFPEAQDWTKFAVKTLTLYFYGDVDNTGSAPLWMKLRDKNNNSARVTFEDAGALAEQAWTEWNMPLDGFAGVDLTEIALMTIGIGPGVASGQFFLDDIRLYPARDILAPAAPALVGYWKMDNNVQDSSGSGNNGTLNGGATYDSAGQIGAALSLDGLDDYVDCGNAVSLNITDAITVAAWIKPRDVANAQHNPFVIKGDESYGLKHNAADYIEFFIYDGSWYGANSPALTADFNNKWHHVLGTYDGIQIKLYIDGKVVGSRLHTGTIAISTYNLNLGRNAQYTDRLYYGLLDDVRIYHGALSSSQISAEVHP